MIRLFKRCFKIKRNNCPNYSSSSSLIVNRLESVLHLKLNRPNERNNLNYELIKRLNDELIRFQNDVTLKSIVLTGSHGNFCAGLDANEIDNQQTLLAFSNLIQLFPLNKPSVVALEGYTRCVGLQLALAFDYKMVEDDTRLQLNESEHLSFHPFIEQLYSNYDLIKLFNRKDKADTKNALFIKQLVNDRLITRNCTSGCCFGVSLELAKCIEKFSLDAIIYDRLKLLNRDSKDTINSIKILNDNVYLRANRFLNDKIGKHGASNVDSLDEIYKRWTPKLVQENEL